MRPPPRIASILARTEPAPEDAGRSEDEIMEDVIANVAQARSERRARGNVRVVIDCNVRPPRP